MIFGGTNINQNFFKNKKFYTAKETINIWDVNVDNILISKLEKKKKKYLTGYLGKVIRPIYLILPKMSWYVDNKLMTFHIDKEKLLKSYKTIWTNIEDLQNIDLDALPVCDDRYIRTNIRAYGNKVYLNFHDSNLPEENIECESFTVISIDSLLVSKKYNPQEYLHNWASEAVDK